MAIIKAGDLEEVIVTLSMTVGRYHQLQEVQEVTIKLREVVMALAQRQDMEIQTIAAHP